MKHYHYYIGLKYIDVRSMELFVMKENSYNKRSSYDNNFFFETKNMISITKIQSTAMSAEASWLSITMRYA